MSKLEALFDAVIVKPLESEETQYGSIFIPDAGKDRNEQGEVIAVGPGIYSVTGTFIENKVQIGETVVFPAFGGTKMTIDGEEFVVMKEQDLLATLEKE